MKYAMYSIYKTNIDTCYVVYTKQMGSSVHLGASQLEDLTFVDGLTLLSHSHQQMQKTTELLNTLSTQLGNNINRSKTKIMQANTKTTNPVTLKGESLEKTNSFTYLGSIINKIGGTEEDVKAMIHHVENNLESKTKQD